MGSWGAFWQDGKSDTKGWWSEQKAFARGMKEKLSDVGFESVNIDNGWWSLAKGGDKWVGAPERWPDGMAAAGKLAHENGFKLTLYFLNCGNNLDWGKKLSQCKTDYGVDTYRSDFGAPVGPAGMAMLDWLIANDPGFRFIAFSGPPHVEVTHAIGRRANRSIHPNGLSRKR